MSTLSWPATMTSASPSRAARRSCAACAVVMTIVRADGGADAMRRLDGSRSSRAETTAIGGVGVRPWRRSGHSSCRRTGPYLSARTVAAPTMITSASVRSSANRRLSAGEDRPALTPLKCAAPSALDTMLARSHAPAG
jgi:hypothetical protein